MIWLVAEVWPWMLASFALGALLVAVSSLRHTDEEEWVAVEPAEPVIPDVVVPLAEPETPEGDGLDGSPFPRPAGGLEGPAPWESEELWSRPVRAVAPSAARSTDEWDEAASNWRTWADEAVGRRADGTFHDQDDDGVGAPAAAPGRIRPENHDLFAADREAEPFDFPHAAPVEAPRLVDPSR